MLRNCQIGVLMNAKSIRIVTLTAGLLVPASAVAPLEFNGWRRRRLSKGFVCSIKSGSERASDSHFAVRCEIVVFEEKNSMALSARNHLKGEITEVILGTVTALITLKVGDNVVESVITKRSAEEMGLKKGDKVTAVIKATEVMIQKG